MRTLDIALAKQTEKDAPEAGAGPGGFLPQLIIVDFRHGHLKGTEELLSKIREYDVSRRSLLVDVVVRSQGATRVKRQVAHADLSAFCTWLICFWKSEGGNAVEPLVSCANHLRGFLHTKHPIIYLG